MLKLTLPASALSAALLLAPDAGADLITWAAVQSITSVSEVSTNGTLVTARNCWAQTFAAPTVNGVPFDAFAPLGWTNGGWTLMMNSSTGDADYDALLDSARVTSGGSASNPTEWGAIQLDTLGTLTIGMQYEIQVWYSDQRPGVPTNVLNDRVMTFSSATGAAVLSGGNVTNLGSLTQGPNSGGLDADPNNQSDAADTVFGSYVIGTFTRTTNDPLWLLVLGTHPLSNNNLRPHLNAFQIRELGGGGGTLALACDPANDHSGGTYAKLDASTFSGPGVLHLEATDGPVGEFGYFLVSGILNDPGTSISNGMLCLGAPTGRYAPAAGGTFNSIGAFDASGVLQSISGNSTVGSGYDVLATLPTPPGGTIGSGDTWYFQCWYRDGQRSNFSNVLVATF